MTTLSPATISQELEKITLPNSNENLVSAKAIKNIASDNGQIHIDLSFGFPIDNYKENLIEQVKKQLHNTFPGQQITVTIEWEVVAHAVRVGLRSLTNVKNIIAIASGKGGVGKSTTCTNLAVALSLQGARVGILDADIYGPNQPQMLGITGEPQATENKKLQPMKAHGLQAISIGMLLPQEDTPVVWRGPMVSTALQQLLHDTEWENLDYLFIDLPPGTGDIQLTLAQKIPVTAAIVVTTPQDIALADVKKAVRMFEKVNVPVLGIVENMSVHICSQCGHEEHIFGTGGADKMAAQYNLDVLGHLPLSAQIRADVDVGKPTAIADRTSAIARLYDTIASKIAIKLALQKKDYSAKFPKIVIERKD